VLKIGKARTPRMKNDSSISDVETFLAHPPLLLIVGSLDAGSRKDVLAYARGLAESQVVAKDACFVDAIKLEGRWLYEVHEGGPGRSLARWISHQLEASPGTKVAIPLAGDRVASVSSVSGDLVTIIYPSDERRSEEASDEVQAMAFGARLSPFFGSASALRNVSAVIFGVSALIFLVAGLTFFVRANAIDIGRIAGRVASSGTGFRTDIAALPSVQLGLAAKDIKTSSGYLSYIKLDKGKWTWAQVSAGPNTGMGKDNE